MGEGTPGNILAIVFALIVASVVLLGIGLLLRGRGRLRSRGAVFGWMLLVLLPLFGGGALFFAKHVADQATGEVQSGVNELPQ